jgi:hypothetical protein
MDMSKHVQAWSGALSGSKEMLTTDVLLVTFVSTDEIQDVCGRAVGEHDVDVGEVGDWICGLGV